MNILEQTLENCKLDKYKTKGPLGRFSFHLLMWLDKNDFSLASKQVDDYKNDLEKEYKGRMKILNKIKQQIKQEEKRQQAQIEKYGCIMPKGLMKGQDDE